MIRRWISGVPSKMVKLMEYGQFPQVDALPIGRLSARAQHALQTGCSASSGAMIGDPVAAHRDRLAVCAAIGRAGAGIFAICMSSAFSAAL
jgi:hypothetical protein